MRLVLAFSFFAFILLFTPVIFAAERKHTLSCEVTTRLDLYTSRSSLFALTNVELAPPHMLKNGEQLLVATADGRLLIIEQKSHRSLPPRMLFQAKDSLLAPPVVDTANGRAYVGDADGNAAALDLKTAKPLWERKAGTSFIAQPVLAGNFVVFVDAQQEVYALAKDTGQQAWRYRHDVRGERRFFSALSPIVVHQGLLQGFSDGALALLNPQNGLPVWEQRLPSSPKQLMGLAAPILPQGSQFFVAPLTDSLFSIGVERGDILEQRPLTGGVSSWASDGSVLYINGVDGSLTAYDRGSSKISWRNSREALDLKAGETGTQPVLYGDYIAIGYSMSDVLIFERGSGKTLARCAIGRGVSAAPLLYNDQLYLISNGGTLYGLALRLRQALDG